MNNKIAEALCEARILKFGLFKYVSGKQGPIYVDVRVLPSTPKSMDAVVEEMKKMLFKIKPDIIAGAETAGIALAAVLSNKTGIPMVYVRKMSKGYGTDSRIEGFIGGGQKAVLVDDMITDGGSKATFIEAIRDAGSVVDDALVVVDREQGGGEVLKKMNVRLHSLITLRELLDYTQKKGIIDEREYNDVLSYLSNPDEWRPKK